MYSYVIITLTVLMVIEIGFMIFLTNYYYGNVERILSYKTEHATQFYHSYISSDNYDIKDLSKQMMEDFSLTNDKRVEFQVVDAGGNVIVTSKGFYMDEKIDTLDFKGAMEGEKTNWKGTSGSGESIMATSTPIKTSSGEIEGVIRFIVSLRTINETLIKFFLISLFIIVLIILGMFIVSFLFSKSIVKPINEITSVARKMAEGQFAERIEKKYDDEIGELADTLNYMAEEIVASNNLKNDFISSISHELRTPLTSIRGWSETILTGDFDDKEEARLGLNIIIKETRRLAQMVEELLDFSKMESGRIALYLEEVSLVDELNDVVSISKRRASQEGINIVYAAEENTPKILGDTNRLKQVFINVIDNAIKFTESGKSVYIHVGSDEEKVYVEIKDEGIGIPKSDINHVVEKFFKGKSKKSGSGIGLAISNEIMELHKGKLRLDSEEGKGTLVTLEFPIMAKEKIEQV